MSSYIYDRSRTGYLTMQNGSSVKDILPLAEFINTCNRSRDLVDADYPFMSFISSTFTTTDQLNNFIQRVKDFNGQLGDYVLLMRQKGAKITIPDPQYFQEKFEKITKAIDEGKVDYSSASKSLAKEFYTVMDDSIKANEMEGKKYGITYTPSKPKIK